MEVYNLGDQSFETDCSAWSFNFVGRVIKLETKQTWTILKELVLLCSKL